MSPRPVQTSFLSNFLTKHSISIWLYLGEFEERVGAGGKTGEESGSGVGLQRLLLSRALHLTRLICCRERAKRSSSAEVLPLQSVIAVAIAHLKGTNGSPAEKIVDYIRKSIPYYSKIARGSLLVSCSAPTRHFRVFSLRAFINHVLDDKDFGKLSSPRHSMQLKRSLTPRNPHLPCCVNPFEALLPADLRMTLNGRNELTVCSSQTRAEFC